MKKFILSLLGLALILAGCGHTTEYQIKTAPPGGQQWIKSYDIGKSIQYYVITGEKVAQIGKPLFKLKGASHESTGWGTNDSSAIELFYISGVDISKAVAVKLKDGSIVKATAIGSHQP